jgi:hypothetical protein
MPVLPQPLPTLAKSLSVEAVNNYLLSSASHHGLTATEFLPRTGGGTSSYVSLSNKEIPRAIPWLSLSFERKRQFGAPPLGCSAGNYVSEFKLWRAATAESMEGDYDCHVSEPETYILR